MSPAVLPGAQQACSQSHTYAPEVVLGLQQHPERHIRLFASPCLASQQLTPCVCTVLCSACPAAGEVWQDRSDDVHSGTNDLSQSIQLYKCSHVPDDTFSAFVNGSSWSEATKEAMLQARAEGAPVAKEVCWHTGSNVQPLQRPAWVCAGTL